MLQVPGSCMNMGKVSNYGHDMVIEQEWIHKQSGISSSLTRLSIRPSVTVYTTSFTNILH